MRPYFVKTPRIVRKLFVNYHWQEKTTKKDIFLTFDDGPISYITPWVLEKLAAFDAKATFFCVGDNISKYPDVFESILKANHSIGNHTFNHLNGWKTSCDNYLENIEKAQVEIQKKIVQKNTKTDLLFRPPYGKIKTSQVNELVKKGYKIIMWDVLSGDFDAGLSKEACLDNVIKHAQSGSIVVFHDSEKSFKNLEYTLPRVLEHFTKKGYTFKCL